MNLFSKTCPWVVVSLMSATSLVGLNNQNCPPYKDSRPKEAKGEPMSVCDNAPSCKPASCCTPAPTPCCDTGCWDMYASGSFIYWDPYQENMELGVVSDTTDPLYTLRGHVVNLDSQYKPGFKVAVGMNFPTSNWESGFEYTWFRSNQHKRVSLEVDGPEVLFPMWLLPDASSPTYFSGRENWRLHMDLLDWEVAKRCCCSGLTLRPSFGIRAAWIRQNIEADYFNESTHFLNQQDVSITQRSHSWGVGLRGGLSANWMFTDHFRVYGQGDGDVLFTQYTNQRAHQQATTAAGLPATGSFFTVRQNNANYLRGHIELEMGLGWGTYFCNQCTHLDFSAGYGFQIFFDQNMFRNFQDDQSLAKSSAPNGNLYIHGLTATVRLDF